MALVLLSAAHAQTMRVFKKNTGRSSLSQRPSNFDILNMILDLNTFTHHSHIHTYLFVLRIVQTIKNNWWWLFKKESDILSSLGRDNSVHWLPLLRCWWCCWQQSITSQLHYQPATIIWRHEPLQVTVKQRIVLYNSSWYYNNNCIRVSVATHPAAPLHKYHCH